MILLKKVGKSATILEINKKRVDSPSIKIPTSSAQNENREHVKHKNTIYNNNIIKKKITLLRVEFIAE